MKTIAEYGSWESNIDAETVIAGNCRNISELQAAKGSVFWLEQQFVGGRNTIFQFKDGKVIEWTPSDVSVRNSVHEYGGGSFIVSSDQVYFVTENGVYLQKDPHAKPQRIVQASKNCRFADLDYFNGNIYAVNEIHSELQEERRVENLLIKITHDGLTQKIVPFPYSLLLYGQQCFLKAFGADFYACPRVSPDGGLIAWMEWNLPGMPWDETTIKVARLDRKGNIDKVVSSLSRKGVNFHGPQWGPCSELYVISDQTGWWNVYLVDFEKGKLKYNIFPVDTEIGSPSWVFGDRQFAVNKTGALLNIAGKMSFKVFDGECKTLKTQFFGQFSHLKLADEDTAYCIASGPARCASVIEVHLNSEEVNVLRESRDSKELGSYDIALGEEITFVSDGVPVKGWFYAPFSSRYMAPEETLPPVLLIAHGGPTANTSNSLSMKIQFFTSRGFAVFDVNYRGSTGYGTKFRNMLLGSWGVVDRDDMINAANYLIQHQLVNPKRVCIMGSSAGGYLLLSAILHSDVFAAAASLYGVSDLVGLFKETHKFEQGYNEQLIGKYPEDLDIYNQRSPINRAKELNCPVCFFHGTEDTVVPMSQSLIFYEALKSKGLITAFQTFPGSVFSSEGHGFRGAAATKMALNGPYYFFCKVLGINPSVTAKIKIDNLPGERKVQAA
ncbi:unnamed protein product [Enterobius vermicularis]|uniref:Peptidase_S9 domain-containing protein n=1 Tax=Enterobius vermicularis TaxID=51028 RepID=A0A0N4VHG4_ENTVE|nr:unnamed protein product [Enterobius vermicularis]